MSLASPHLPDTLDQLNQLGNENGTGDFAGSVRVFVNALRAALDRTRPREEKAVGCRCSLLERSWDDRSP
ncbi:hypothetical protein ACWF2L_40085, partial [Streptomyces anulatus]